MKDKIIRLMEKKTFHIAMVITIVAILLFILGIVVLRYQVEGETNMPFSLSKIIVISSSEGKSKEGTNKWNLDLNQNNDIYLYLNKNKNYAKEEVIKSIKIDKIEVESKIGEAKFYRPNILEKGSVFKNSEENKITDKIEYKGAMEANLKELKIANQGGVVSFRYANEKIGEYKTDDEAINHSELLKKAGIQEENLKSKLKFDFTIITGAGKEYKANISLDLPIKDIVNKGTTSLEITDLKDIVFKRTKN